MSEICGMLSNVFVCVHYRSAMEFTHMGSVSVCLIQHATQDHHPMSTQGLQQLSAGGLFDRVHL